MKIAWLALGAMALATSAQGELLPEFAEGRCYGRVYSTDHMRENPEQNVAALSIGFRVEEGAADRSDVTFPFLEIEAVAAATPKNDEDEVTGKTYRSEPGCYKPEKGDAADLIAEDYRWVNEGIAVCSIDCDGGDVSIVSVDETSLVIKIQYLATDDASDSDTNEIECHSAFSLGEPKTEPTTYKLYRMPDQACDQRLGQSAR